MINASNEQSAANSSFEGGAEAEPGSLVSMGLFGERLSGSRVQGFLSHMDELVVDVDALSHEEFEARFSGTSDYHETA